MYKVGSSLTLARLKSNFKSFSKLWFCSLNDIVLLILWDDFGNDDLEQQYRAQLFEGRLVLNLELNLTLVSFSCAQKHFLG